MFSTFFVKVSNHKVIKLSMLVDSAVDNHYMGPEIQLAINQHIERVVPLEKTFQIEVAPDGTRYICNSNESHPWYSNIPQQTTCTTQLVGHNCIRTQEPLLLHESKASEIANSYERIPIYRKEGHEDLQQ